MNRGYKGYSMSLNAVEAYQSGEKPLSKWTKSNIIEAVKEVDQKKADMIRSIPLGVLRDKLLVWSSWHHTSSHYNKTDFFELNEDAIDDINENSVREWSEKKDKVLSSVSYKGDIDWIEWTGTRNYPKAIKKRLDNVNIEEKGCFYIVTDDNGVVLLRKKIGSNGTCVKKR